MKCPLRKWTETNEFGGPSIAFDEDCLESECAWWFGKKCAVLVVADALDSISSMGIAIDKREE